MRQFKVAVIGAGYMASEHIKAFADMSEIKILGIHSRTRSRAEELAQKYGIPFVYDSVEALYNGTQADLVIVAVPELSTKVVSTAVFRHSWLVLIEKPAGYNLQEAEEIFVAANSANCKAYVAFNRRHYASTRSVIKELEAVEGQRLVQVFDQENSKVATEGGQPLLVVKNWMYANSIHIIDYFCMFCRGDVTRIDHVIPWNSQDPRFVLAKIQYSSGDIGVYQAIWNGPGPWAVTVTTQAKRWEMRPLEQATFQLYKTRNTEVIPAHSWDTQFKAGIRLQAEEAVKAVQGEANALATLADGIETMKLVRLIYEA